MVGMIQPATSRIVANQVASANSWRGRRIVARRFLNCTGDHRVENLARANSVAISCASQACDVKHRVSKHLLACRRIGIEFAGCRNDFGEVRSVGLRPRILEKNRPNPTESRRLRAAFGSRHFRLSPHSRSPGWVRSPPALNLSSRRFPWAPHSRRSNRTSCRSPSSLGWLQFPSFRQLGLL